MEKILKKIKDKLQEEYAIGHSKSRGGSNLEIINSISIFTQPTKEDTQSRQLITIYPDFVNLNTENEKIKNEAIILMKKIIDLL